MVYKTNKNFCLQRQKVIDRKRFEYFDKNKIIYLTSFSHEELQSQS